jgi:hypothetical protein
MSLAGPIAGVLCATGIGMYLHKKYPRSEKYSLSKWYCYTLAAEHLLTLHLNLMPNSDGALALRAYKQWKAAKVA